MRVEPLVGDKVWFGPRRLGWGLEPVSWEGWLLTAVTLAASHRLRGRRRARHLLGGALVLAAVLKGTSPGGRKARAVLAAERDRPGARAHAGTTATRR